MKQGKRLLALLLAAVMCITSLPLNALAAYYAPGTVVEDDGSESDSIVIDEDSGMAYYSAGTVTSDDDPLPGGQQAKTNTEYNGIPDNFEKEYADEVFINEYGEEVGLFTITEDTSSGGIMTAANTTTRKIHFYVDYHNTLNDGANGANFTILGGAQWVNSYPKTAVLLDSNGNETNQWFAAYCLNYGLDLPDRPQTETSYLTDAQKTIIGDILSMGYQHTSGQNIDDDSRYKWLITQIYIWAVCQGTLQYNKKTGVNELTGKNVETVDEFLKQVGSLADYVGGGNYMNFYTYSAQLLYNVLTLRRRPVFTYATEAEAKLNKNAIVLEPDENTGTYRALVCFSDDSIKYDTTGLQFWNYGLKDNDFSSAYLTQNYDFLNSGISGLSVKYRADSTIMSGGKYGLEFNTNVEYSGVMTSKKFSRTIKGGKNSCLVFTDGNANTQNIAMFLSATDTINAYYSVKINIDQPTTPSGLEKESEDGVVAGISFTVTGGGKTYTMTTDSSGNIDLSTLPKYEQKEELDENDQPTGNMVDDYEKPITYTVSENTAVRYVTPAEQGSTITPANGDGVTFHNILKKWETDFTKYDPNATADQQARHNGSQGDATLAGAQYGLYCNGELIDTFYTDANGEFETWNYWECGSADGDLNYTLRELSPSTGYLLSSTEIALDTDPARYSEEYNHAPSVSGAEQIIKGNIYLTKHTDKGDTGIEEPEKGAEFQIYLKSSGGYEKALEEERDLLVIDENGHAQSKKLPYGTYVVHQTKGWEYKELMDDFEVFICENGKTYDYILNNRPFEALVTIMKKDADSGRIIPVSGVGFKIRNTKTGQYVIQHINYPTPKDLSVFYTDTSGKLMMPEKLEGGEYELIEVAAAYGYVLDETPVPFVVDGTVKEVIVEKSNKAQMGVLAINKRGEVFTSVENSGTMGAEYTPIFAEAPLAGAVYEVRALDHITTPDGTIRYAAGTLVDTITTDEDGWARTKPLYLGRYTVLETKAPDGYRVDSVMKVVTLTYGNSTEEISTTMVYYTDERQKTEIDIWKKMETDRTFGYDTQHGVENVRFGLYANEDIVTADGKEMIPKDGLIEVVGLGKNQSTFNFSSDLPMGSYYIKEIQTDDAYLMDESKWLFVVRPQKQTTDKIVIHASSNEYVQNVLKRGDILGKKVDNKGAALAGALIGLFEADETNFIESYALRVCYSDEDGAFQFTEIPYGSYVVREIAQPEGYVLNDTPYPVAITENKEQIEIEIENQIIVGSVQLEKTDEDYTGTRLSGAVFTVYADTDADGELTEKDEEVGTLTETAKGIYTMQKLPYGAYFVKETTAPGSYILDSTPQYFEIRKNGVQIKLSMKNKAQTGSLKIVKTAEDKLIAGIKFTVRGELDAGGIYEEEFETDKNGEIFIDNLRLGEYTVSEVLDESTIRYRVEDDKTVVISSGSTAEVKFYNQLRRGSIYVVKKDLDDRTLLLPGAEFTVYADTDMNGEFDEAKDKKFVVLQNEGGLYWTEDLAAGGYFLVETKAPEGYVADEEAYYVEIDKDTEQLEISNTDEGGFLNSRIEGFAELTKLDKDSQKPLAGAKFAVKNAAGELVAEGVTEKDGIFLFENLPYGEYTYQELAAPAGYELDNAVYKFRIVEDSLVVKLTAYNEKTPFYVPQTGDGKINPTFFYLLAAVLSAAGLIVAGVVLAVKRKKI